MAGAKWFTSADPRSATGRLLTISRRRRRSVDGLLAVGPLGAAWLLLFVWWAALMLAGITAWRAASTVDRLRAMRSGARSAVRPWPIPRAMYLVG